MRRYVAIGDSTVEGLEDPGPDGVYVGWADRLARKQHSFPALQDAIDDVFNARIGDVSGRGKLAADMRDLYDYVTLRLTQANLRNDEKLLEECQSLIEPLRSAWASIGPQVAKVSP